MSKFHVKHTIHHNGFELPHGHVVEFDDEEAATLVKKGHLVRAEADAEVTAKPKSVARKQGK